jgi:perosamine synthetase
MADRILVAGPSITEREVELTAEAVRNSCGPRNGEMIERFERAVARYTGRQYGIATPSCTSAIHLALVALGVGPGDEVIVPDVTWIGSVAPVAYVGATPVLVDILPDTWCIDPAAVERAITPRTKAVIGVDLYGSLCDWNALTRIARAHGLHLIEDAAEAIGSSYASPHGEFTRAGGFGNFACFSFHGTKTVSTGEGGMIVGDDPAVKKRLLYLANHGRSWKDREYQFEEIGFKYRMSAVTAALGVAQMERIDDLVAHKRRIFGWYRERLAGWTLNAEPLNTLNSYWMTTVVAPVEKFELMAVLDQRGIDVRPFFSRLSDLPVSKGWIAAPMKPLAVTTHGVNLPSGFQMTEALVDRVCSTLREVVLQPAACRPGRPLQSPSERWPSRW